MELSSAASRSSAHPLLNCIGHILVVTVSAFYLIRISLAHVPRPPPSYSTEYFLIGPITYVNPHNLRTVFYTLSRIGLSTWMDGRLVCYTSPSTYFYSPVVVSLLRDAKVRVRLSGPSETRVPSLLVLLQSRVSVRIFLKPISAQCLALVLLR